MSKILITTSGLGTRLGNKSKILNKALLRLGDKAIISHILDLYPKNSSFIITVGYKSELVKQYLKIAHPNLDIKFVEIDKYEGKGSSLLYSMFQSRNLLQEPFIFHASDSIIKSFEIEKNQNLVFGSKKGDSSLYTSFNCMNENVIEFLPKGELKPDYNYVGVAYISDYESFWQHASKLLKQNPHDSTLNDISVFNKMLSNSEFKYKIANQWNDTGSVINLKKAKQKYLPKVLDDVLDKEQESIYFIDGHIIKFFNSKTDNLNRVYRAKKLKGVVPDIINHTENFYKYKLLEGNLFSKNCTPNNISSFLNWANKNLWITSNSNQINALSKKFYYEKTLKRVSSFLSKYPIEDKKEIINDEKIPSVYELINLIPEEFYHQSISSLIHGDFILDNCIYNKGNFNMIDWRQDFGGELDYGDLYYDLGKLAHNLILNHNIINLNLFEIKDLSENQVNVNIYRKQNLVESEVEFYRWLKENNYNITRIKILRSIIWLNMSPLHHAPYDRFLFNFGKLNLYKTLLKNG